MLTETSPHYVDLPSLRNLQKSTVNSAYRAVACKLREGNVMCEHFICDLNQIYCLLLRAISLLNSM